MKKFFVLLGWQLIASATVQGQTGAEWFAQKETQLRYLRESLSALTAYAAQVQKGYDIAQKGLSTIREIRQGDLQLHQERMASLRRVHPLITAYGERLAPPELLADLRVVCQSLLHTLAQSGQLSTAELRSHQRICRALLEESEGILRAIEVLTTGGAAELSDDARVQRLNALTRQLRERYAAARSLDASSRRLAYQRYRIARELPTLKRYYGPAPTQ